MLSLVQEHFVVPEHIENSPKELFLFILSRVYLYGSIRSLLFKICLGILLITVLVYSIAPASVLIHKRLLTMIVAFGFLFVCFPLCVILEEWFHANACILKGENSHVDELRLFSLVFGKIQVACLGGQVKLRGKFKPLDLIHIWSAGPFTVLLLLLILSTIWILIQHFLNITEPVTLFYPLMISLIPLSSLIPFNFLVETDGLKILKTAKENKYSLGFLLVQFLCNSFLVLSYIFGMRSIIGYKGGTVAEHKVLAYRYVKQGKIKKAAILLEKAYLLDPKDASICNNLAYCYVELGISLKRAKILSKRAVKLAPHDIDYLDTLVRVYRKNGNSQKAERILRRIENTEKCMPILNN